jgi:lactoylglutathione lyase
MSAVLDPSKQGADLGYMISDWDATKRFYVDLLGFEHTNDIPFPLAGSNGTMHRVQAGTITLKFTQLGTVPAARHPGGGVAGAVGLRYVTFWVRNLDALAASLASEGVRTVVKVTEVRPGVRITIVEDPDANLVELLEVN